MNQDQSDDTLDALEVIRLCIELEEGRAYRLIAAHIGNHTEAQDFVYALGQTAATMTMGLSTRKRALAWLAMMTKRWQEHDR